MISYYITCHCISYWYVRISSQNVNNPQVVKSDILNLPHHSKYKLFIMILILILIIIKANITSLNFLLIFDCLSFSFSCRDKHVSIKSKLHFINECCFVFNFFIIFSMQCYDLIEILILCLCILSQK